jgi:glycosyltransferase involved in cell wall biosynthesis
MKHLDLSRRVVHGNCSISVVIPCFNEESTLQSCVESVLEAFAPHPDIHLEIVIVDDFSTDKSVLIAQDLALKHESVKVDRHDRNQGKGAALRTGFRSATCEYVAVQDADLEYDPKDLVGLLSPLRKGLADVVFGSRFLSSGEHRVLYFWHSLGNQFLTFLSNMFTNLNLTDMETCYKLFRREVIQSIDIQENRFGFEPEITAKVAARGLRIYEMGISYHGRTYDEGKKIGVRDGFRALYCIIRYNGFNAPPFLQFLVYVFVGGTAAVINLCVFLLAMALSIPVWISASLAFVVAAIANYLLCIKLLFRHQVRWNATSELLLYGFLVAFLGIVDVAITNYLVGMGTNGALAKCLASAIGLVLNFTSRRSLIFPEKGNRS